jgi:hypothetical protein
LPPTPVRPQPESPSPPPADAPRLELPRAAAVSVSGRRIQAVAAATGWEVLVGDTRVLGDAGVDGAAPSGGWIGPGVAGRSLVAQGGGLTERWLVGLDLPAAVWEIVPEHEPISIAWMLPAGDARLSGDADRLTVVRPGGFWTDLTVGGGRLRLEPAGDAVRVVCHGPGPLRLEVAAGHDGADRDRVLALLGRGADRLADAWRQLARSAPRLETPDPGIDQAFAWAWLRGGGRPDPAGPAPAATPEALSAAATRFLADPGTPDPGPARAVLAESLGGLWGVAAEAPGALSLQPLLPPSWAAMALRRWRVGRTVLDVELRRRRGDLVARVHRVFGPRLVVTLQPRGRRIESATVDDVELLGGRARFEAADRHVILFPGGAG